jgi:hypothetical protein
MSYFRIPKLEEHDPRIWNSVGVNLFVENELVRSVIPGDFLTWGAFIAAHPGHQFDSCHDPWNYIQEAGGHPTEATPLFALGRWIRLSTPAKSPRRVQIDQAMDALLSLGVKLVPFVEFDDNY